MCPRAINDPTSTRFHSIRTRKKLAGGETFIGMALENAPAPSVTPFVLIVQFAIGISRLVVVKTV